MAGAETTVLSSTTATMHTFAFAPLPAFEFGWVATHAESLLLYASSVSAVHLPVPSPLKVRSTFQPAPLESRLAAAEERSVPRTLATSIRYWVCPPSSQATACC